MIQTILHDYWLWIVVTLGVYCLCVTLQSKIPSVSLRPFANPLLLSSVLIIAILLVTDVDYATYQKGGQYIGYLITPATVALGIKLYENVVYLRTYYKPILIGITSGVLFHTGVLFILVKLFGLDSQLFATLYPKSITTAIAIGVSESIGGIIPLTVAIVVLTGVIGGVICEFLLKRLDIYHPVAQGIAIGTAAHAVGTSKAIEIGDVQGAMSGLAIVVTGIVVVILAPLMPILMNLL